MRVPSVSASRRARGNCKPKQCPKCFSGLTVRVLDGEAKTLIWSCPVCAFERRWVKPNCPCGSTREILAVCLDWDKNIWRQTCQDCGVAKEKAHAMTVWEMRDGKTFVDGVEQGERPIVIAPKRFVT